MGQEIVRVNDEVDGFHLRTAFLNILQPGSLLSCSSLAASQSIFDLPQLRFYGWVRYVLTRDSFQCTILPQAIAPVYTT